MYLFHSTVIFQKSLVAENGGGQNGEKFILHFGEHGLKSKKAFEGPIGGTDMHMAVHSRSH